MTASARPARFSAADLTTCDREPIHVPGSIQPHGMLLVLSEPDLVVEQVSRNVDRFLGRAVEDVLGRPVGELLGAAELARLRDALASDGLDQSPYLVGVMDRGGEPLELVAHRHDDQIILELERTGAEASRNLHEVYPLVRSFTSGLHDTDSITSLGDLTAREVRRLTGFDRVLIYRFDDDWNGQVIAESRSDAYPSLLEHWFPAPDIPQQARELYRLNRWRLIVDAGYEPVPIEPALHPRTGRPTDLSYASLRSVSPVHLEYLHNMGVVASMSISVVHEGRLWGLISCHHASPRTLGFAVRTACEFVGQTFALRLSAQANTAEYEHRIHLKSIQTRLLAAMAESEPFIRALSRESHELLEFARASGAAVLFEGECTLIGDTPDESQVQALVDWLLREGRREEYHTDCLSAQFPEAEAYRERVSGLLAIPLSTLHRSYVFWFRAEVPRTVRWGGDPRKALAPGDEGLRLHPRASFETWRETVRGRSLPWLPSEIDAAAELRQAIVSIVLRKAEELAQLSAELRRSNQELEAFSYSVSHDLRAPFRHIVGYAELLRERLRDSPDEAAHRYVSTIVDSAHFAGTLVDNLLTFSQIGRAALHLSRVDTERLIHEVRDDVMQEVTGRPIEWRIGGLPVVQADLAMLRQVIQNLFANAVKYTRGRVPAIIEVSSESDEREATFVVRDNGVGFEMQYVDKLFGVFQRLHRMEDFEGTGIGLANVRRIVARHGGRTWASGEPDVGATFYFTLPIRPQPQEVH